jgi:pre-mRNA-splicing factor SYF2
LLKPDLIAYNKQKEAALGLAPGTLVKTLKPRGAESDEEGDAADKGKGKEVIAANANSVAQRLANENLYRDANSLVYADNKPSEDVIDKLVEKLNKEYDSFHTSLLAGY